MNKYKITTSTYAFEADTYGESKGIMLFLTEDGSKFYDCFLVEAHEDTDRNATDWSVWSFYMTRDDYDEIIDRVGIDGAAEHIAENGLYSDRGCSCTTDSLDDIIENLEETATTEIADIVRRHFGGISYVAKQIPVAEQIDPWDEWASDAYEGWVITGNPSLMPHGETDLEWETATGWAGYDNPADALRAIAEWMRRNNQGEYADDINRVLENGGIYTGFALNPFIMGLARFVLDFYSNSNRVDREDLLAGYMTIITGTAYAHKTIRGYVQREWNECYYPVREEKSVSLCEAYYFNHVTQFRVTGNGADGLIYSVMDDTREEMKKALADQLYCDPEEIEMHCITDSHIVYDYETF